MENNDKKEVKQQKKYQYIVSFPHLGNYYAPIYNLVTHIVDPNMTKVLMPKPITNETIMKGAKVSPDFACVPFKYNMGNYIEALENGANVLLQAGGGCRYGYYYPVQEQILRDMGYQFTFLPLMEEKGVDVKGVYQKMKMLNPHLSFSQFCYRFFIAFRLITIQDALETKMRLAYALQQDTKSYDRIQKELLRDILAVSSMSDVIRIKKEYTKRIEQVPLNEQEPKIKIGIIGELFTSMEPYASFFIERELSRMHCQVKRYTTATYLLFEKGFSQKKVMKQASGYLSYPIGADGAESVAHSLEMIEEGYDGLIHIKPFGCAPEVNAMPMLQRISKEKEIPIMYLTFDEQTTATGIQTRLEAFYDMLWMKKEAMDHTNLQQMPKVETTKVMSQEVKTTLQTQE